MVVSVTPRDQKPRVISRRRRNSRSRNTSFLKSVNFWRFFLMRPIDRGRSRSGEILSRCENFVSFGANGGLIFAYTRLFARNKSIIFCFFLFLSVSFCFFLFHSVSRFVSNVKSCKIYTLARKETKKHLLRILENIGCKFEKYSDKTCVCRKKVVSLHPISHYRQS